MPANLTPQYSKAEEEYRKAQSPAEQVTCLETMLRLIPKHKGTEKLQADLKTKLKEAKEDFDQEKKSPKKGAKSVKFPRQGAGQIVILGAPNAGKSRLLAELTSAKPAIADYPFTTREPMAGMMPWQDVMVQLIDTPPVTDSQFEAYMPGLVRAADACVLCFDGSSDDAPEQTLLVIDQLRQRKTNLAQQTGFDEENLAIVNVKTILVATRGDDPSAADRLDLYRELGPPPLEEMVVELDRKDSIEALRDRIYGLLGVIRVYTKAPGKPADKTAPFTLPVGGAIEDLAPKIHRDLEGKVKHARIWGEGVHDGQAVGPDHVLHDGDLVELHT